MYLYGGDGRGLENKPRATWDELQNKKVNGAPLTVWGRALFLMAVYFRLPITERRLGEENTTTVYYHHISPEIYWFALRWEPGRPLASSSVSCASECGVPG